MGTTFDRGTGFGGDDGFKIKQGGQIRWSFVVSTASTSTWRRGNVLELLDDGTVDLDSGATNGRLKGLAVERRDPIGGRPDDDETLGSKKASLLLDEAICINPQIASGIAVSVNDTLHPNGAGLLTNVVSGPVLGKALAAVIGDGGAGGANLLMFYSNQSATT